MAIKAHTVQLIELCERLADATATRDVEWRREGEDEYIWEHKEGRIAIGARDRDGQPPYELTVFNGDGAKVEELASALVDDDRPAEWNDALAELYRVARSNALGADEIIAALMQALPTRNVGKADDQVVPAVTSLSSPGGGGAPTTP